MPYIKTTVKAGKTILVEKHYSARYGRKIKRGDNCCTTPEAMGRVNERKAQKKLTILLNANYKAGDFHLVLTYRKEERPDETGAKKRLELFLRKMREAAKRQGRELKYIAVTEYRKKAIHHHLVIEQMDTAVLKSLWPYGRPKITLLDDSGDYSKLAEYLVKETSETFRSENAPSRKRWNESKNLYHPKPKVKVLKSERWSSQPKPQKGYYIFPYSLEEWEDQKGFRHQSYIMARAG